MTRRVLTAVAIASFAVASVVAQSPKGWKVRADRSTNATDPDAAGAIKFMAMGSGFHAQNPQAAVYWDPANTASGAFTIKGTFTLVKPSNHTNYYGIVFGGKDLEGPKQTYLYFLVAQDGSWLLKQRNGDTATADVAPRAMNSAVKKPDATGQSKNALEVRVGTDKVDFVVNGTVVHSMAKSALPSPADGIVGLRVNHQLEVMIDGFAVAKG
jgi:hypothetical protein